VDLAINNDKRRTTMATVTNTNAKTIAGNGLGGRTRIINLANTNMTQAELDAAVLFLSQGGVAGTNDAHTVAGISVLTESGVFTPGTTDAVQVAIQGTGAFTAAADFGGVTGTTSSLIADYTA
jgi:hypothetical protein